MKHIDEAATCWANRQIWPVSRPFDALVMNFMNNNK